MGDHARSKYAIDESAKPPDPEISRLKKEVAQLKLKASEYKNDGKLGKAKLVYFDIDLLKQEIRALEVSNETKKRRNKTSRAGECCLLICCPFLVVVQLLCCVSTAATGEFAKKNKADTKMLQNLEGLGKDILARGKHTMAKKNKGPHSKSITRNKK